ncbi:hypothetical protein SEVIR_5G217600v4 [Setaria viridis]|uniref:Laccase n=2 Tax=Setaria viridis TaxID=4556 RepID=A0A4U6UG73_SETVI|nr:laccase-15-like isoform X1 [Setaria viridis]TKW15151.1 hypothetical protein SEVIR_5G217600v2 [Setaria viridis]
MKNRSLPAASAIVAAAIVFFLSVMALPVAVAVVEHTFVVSQVNMTHLCKETLVTVVNGQLPGPPIEVTEGDSVAVHIVNESPYNITIHWHGVKQRLNCWSDGVPMITQCPIKPNQNFTYRFNVTGQEGTLWWHAHVPCLRASLHGALIIRPRNGASSYPFPKPHKEIPIIIGEWWEKDLSVVGRNMRDGSLDDDPSASTINGKLGDLFNCSGAPEDGYVLEVEPGKTYMLRVINAALFYEYYLKIAGHKFTVVAADANYVNPYTTDVIAVSPGETVDAILIADAPPGSYYMVAQPVKAPLPDTRTPVYVTRGVVQYNSNRSYGNGTTEQQSSSHGANEGIPFGDAPVVPEMPGMHNTVVSFDFHGNLTSLRHPRRPMVPLRVDEHLFIALGLGMTPCRRGQSCNRRKGDERIIAATMNNVSFHLSSIRTPILEAHYYHTGGRKDDGTLLELPDRPPRTFNFTDPALIPEGDKEALLEPTSKETVARWFRHGATVEVVFQSTALLQGSSNPMHLHGHDMYLLAQGHGNYDAAKDVARYNLVNPPMKNTVHVPNLGWAAVRFVADNPGVWFMHCHYEFHLSMGMAAMFIVEDGPTVGRSLPPPPMDFATCGNYESYLQTKKSEVSHVDGV